MQLNRMFARIRVVRPYRLTATHSRVYLQPRWTNNSTKNTRSNLDQANPYKVETKLDKTLGSRGVEVAKAAGSGYTGDQFIDKKEGSGTFMSNSSNNSSSNSSNSNSSNSSNTTSSSNSNKNSFSNPSSFSSTSSSDSNRSSSSSSSSFPSGSFGSSSSSSFSSSDKSPSYDRFSNQTSVDNRTSGANFDRSSSQSGSQFQPQSQSQSQSYYGGRSSSSSDYSSPSGSRSTDNRSSSGSGFSESDRYSGRQSSSTDFGDNKSSGRGSSSSSSSGSFGEMASKMADKVADNFSGSSGTIGQTIGRMAEKVSDKLSGNNDRSEDRFSSSSSSYGDNNNRYSSTSYSGGSQSFADSNSGSFGRMADKAADQISSAADSARSAADNARTGLGETLHKISDKISETFSGRPSGDNAEGRMSRSSSRRGRDSIFNPFDLSSVFRNNFFDNFSDSSMRTDIVERDADYRVICDMPGVDKKNVNITMRNNYLEIYGERSESGYDQENSDQTVHRQERYFGSYTRRLALPDDAAREMSGIKAKCENGVLTVTIPKSRSSSRDRYNINIE